MSQLENKENRPGATKIPLPLKPLPQLPKKLLKSYSKDIVKERLPLRSLSLHDNAPFASSSTQLAKTKEEKKNITPLRLDTRFVTIKRGSREEEYQGKLTFFVDGGRHKTNDVQIHKASAAGPSLVKPKTPAEEKLAEKPIPSVVKNIKRSLKRPHSKEIQGISSCDKKKCDEKARRRLFQDSFVNLILKSPDEATKRLAVGQEIDSEEIVECLLGSEKIVGHSTISTTSRACIVNWLIKVVSQSGDLAVVQTAVWLLDRLTTHKRVVVDKLQLAAAACFWIAQKMHGPVSTASSIVRVSDNAFTVQKLLDAEKNVLDQLRFPTQPIIPNDFITYLAWLCNADKPGTIEVAASFLCMSALMVNKRCCCEYPSVLAAAAVWNAVKLLKLTECLPRLTRCQLFQRAKAKAQDFPMTCSVQRKAVTQVSSPLYGYKTLMEHYGSPPACIALRISEAIKREKCDTSTALKMVMVFLTMTVVCFLMPF